MVVYFLVEKAGPAWALQAKPSDAPKSATLFKTSCRVPLALFVWLRLFRGQCVRSPTPLKTELSLWSIIIMQISTIGYAPEDGSLGSRRTGRKKREDQFGAFAHWELPQFSNRGSGLGRGAQFIVHVHLGTSFIHKVSL